MDDDPVRGALSALVFSVMSTMSDTGRTAMIDGLASMERAAANEGQPKTAELIGWLVRSAAFARQHLTKH